jgi:transcription antitermination factor NusG
MAKPCLKGATADGLITLELKNDLLLTKLPGEPDAMTWGTLHTSDRQFERDLDQARQIAVMVPQQRWYAVFTLPKNEKSVIKHLELRNVESFLPTYEIDKIWKNRQRVKLVLPLFPTYLFVRINQWERARVLQTPGVLQIVGNGRSDVYLPDAEMEFLRSGLNGRKVEPYPEFATGARVRIKSGVLQGVEGVLVRKRTGLRFVLAIDLINQRAAVEIDADDLELVLARA